LICSDCGRPLWVGYHAWKNHPPSDDNRFYYCAGKDPGHPRLKETDLLPEISARLQAALLRLDDIPLPAPADDPLSFLRKQSDELAARRGRLTEAYLSGSIPLPEFNSLLAALTLRQSQTVEALARAEDISARQAERLGARRSLADQLDRLPAYLLRADPQSVNASLRHVLSRILVDADGKIELVWV
jgi:hypothetical protein